MTSVTSTLPPASSAASSPNLRRTEKTQVQPSDDAPQHKWKGPASREKLVANVEDDANRRRSRGVSDIIATSIQPENTEHTSSDGSQQSLTLEQYITAARRVKPLARQHSLSRKSPPAAMNSRGEDEMFRHADTRQLRRARSVSKIKEESVRRVHHAESHQSDEDLDDIDLELLNIGRNRGHNQQGSQSSPKSQPQNLKHARSSENHELCGSHSRGLHAAEEDGSEPSPSKRPRSNEKAQKVEKVESRGRALQKSGVRNSVKWTMLPEDQPADDETTQKQERTCKKRQPRRLPVDVLVTTSESFTTLEIEELDAPPLELSHDPISHVTKEVEYGRTSEQGQAIKPKPLYSLANVGRRQNVFGSIHVEDFRFPKAKTQSTRSKARLRKNPTYSDGFEGTEAKPIGKVMPVKKLIRRRTTRYKTNVFSNGLTLVSDRTFDLELKQMEEVFKQNTNPKDEGNKENEQMLLDEYPGTVMIGTDFVGPIRNRSLGSAPRALITPTKTSRQLPQDLLLQDVSSSEDSCMAPMSFSQRMKFKRSLARAVSSMGEVDVATQLMMVSIKRREPASEDEGESSNDDSDGKTSSEMGSDDDLGSEEDKTEEEAEEEGEGDENDEEDEEDGEEDEGDDEAVRSDDNAAAAKLRMQSPGSSVSPRIPRRTSVVIRPRSHETVSSFNDSLVFEEPKVQQNIPTIIEEATRKNTEMNKGVKHLKIAPDIRPQIAVGASADQIVQTPKNHASNTLGAKFAKVKAWAMTREPSGPALEAYRKAEFKKANVDLNDPEAAAKLHVATAKVPSSAVKPGGWVFNPQTPRKSRQRATTSEKASPNVWRTRVPTPSNVTIEVDEDIMDTPTKPSAKRQGVGDRLLNSLNRSLSLGRSKIPSLNREDAFVAPQGSQESIILGSTQLLFPQVPESQLSYQDSQAQSSFQISKSRVGSKVIPETSYSTRASQQLYNPTRRISKMIRSKTMPVESYVLGRNEIPEMAGGVTVSGAFGHTVSSSVSQSQPNSDTPHPSQHLRTLTRNASFGMGTAPSSSRRRMKSLPFVPPFKKT